MTAPPEPAIESPGIELPRIELHCHLDCCVRLATLAELSARRGIRPVGSWRELAVAPPTPTSLADYLAAIDVALPVMQSAAELSRIAGELVEDWLADGVVHGEVRFAPQLHQREGLSLDDAVAAVAAGLARASQGQPISTSLLVCCLRHQEASIGEAIVELAIRRSDVIDGLDLAGAEAGNPGWPLRAVFERARARGVPITVHAGEAAGAGSVREAIEVLGAERIGHGVQSTEDPELVADLARLAITLECCPTSNVQTGAVASLASHPIHQLQRAGVPVTVSTDGRTTSDTTVTRELALVSSAFRWGRAELLAAQRAAARAAFVSPERRAELLAALATC